MFSLRMFLMSVLTTHVLVSMQSVCVAGFLWNPKCFNFLLGTSEHGKDWTKHQECQACSKDCAADYAGDWFHWWKHDGEHWLNLKQCYEKCYQETIDGGVIRTDEPVVTPSGAVFTGLHLGEDGMPVTQISEDMFGREISLPGIAFDFPSASIATGTGTGRRLLNEEVKIADCTIYGSNNNTRIGESRAASQIPWYAMALVLHFDGTPSVMFSIGNRSLGHVFVHDVSSLVVDTTGGQLNLAKIVMPGSNQLTVVISQPQLQPPVYITVDIPPEAEIAPVHVDIGLECGPDYMVQAKRSNFNFMPSQPTTSP